MDTTCVRPLPGTSVAGAATLRNFIGRIVVIVRDQWTWWWQRRRHALPTRLDTRAYGDLVRRDQRMSGAHDHHDVERFEREWDRREPDGYRSWEWR